MLSVLQGYPLRQLPGLSAGWEPFIDYGMTKMDRAAARAMKLTFAGPPRLIRIRLSFFAAHSYAYFRPYYIPTRTRSINAYMVFGGAQIFTLRRITQVQEKETTGAPLRFLPPSSLYPARSPVSYYSSSPNSISYAFVPPLLRKYLLRIGRFYRLDIIG